MLNASWIISSLVIAILSIAVFCVALLIARKLIAHQKLRKHHDVAGFLLGTVGVLYSVILGFTVVNAKDRYSQAANTVHIEATMLADLYRDAAFFPEISRDRYLSFMLYLVYCLDNPFRGTQAIRPTALEQSLVYFDELDHPQKS